MAPLVIMAAPINRNDTTRFMARPPLPWEPRARRRTTAVRSVTIALTGAIVKREARGVLGLETGGGPRLELVLFGRALERRGGDLAVRDRARHFVEVSGADEALVLDGGVALLAHRELPILHARVGRHALVAIAGRQLV